MKNKTKQQQKGVWYVRELFSSIFLFLIYAKFLCDSILDCLCTYFCLIVVFLYHYILAVFLLNSIIVSMIYNVNILSFSLHTEFFYVAMCFVAIYEY